MNLVPAVHRLKTGKKPVRWSFFALPMHLAFSACMTVDTPANSMAEAPEDGEGALQIVEVEQDVLRCERLMHSRDEAPWWIYEEVSLPQKGDKEPC